METQALAPRHYNEAMKFMAASGTVSTSAIQRQYSIGYNQAAALIEEFERDGIVSQPNQAGRRTMLIRLDEISERERAEVPSEDPQEREAEEAMEAAVAPALGHNSRAQYNKEGTGQSDDMGGSDVLSQAARQKLRLTIQRIEALEADRKEIAESIKEVYGEAKALGYDTKALRSCIRIRKQDRQERQEQEAILEVYLDALGEL